VSFVISGFHRDADEICALLGYYATSSGNPLPTFRDYISVPSSGVKKSKSGNPLPTFRDNVPVTTSRVKKSKKKLLGPLKVGPIRCPETSVKDYHSTLRNIPEDPKSCVSSSYVLIILLVLMYVLPL
jgi:hypothetical protein